MAMKKGCFYKRIGIVNDKNSVTEYRKEVKGFLLGNGVGVYRDKSVYRFIDIASGLSFCTCPNKSDIEVTLKVFLPTLEDHRKKIIYELQCLDFDGLPEWKDEDK